MSPLDRLRASARGDKPVVSLDLRGVDASFAELDGVQAVMLSGGELDARGSSWRRAFLEMPGLADACFEGACLDGSSMLDPVLDGADFFGASLRDVVWSSPLATEARFDEADLAGATLDGGAFRDATFRDACLAGASVVDCGFEGCDLTGADLRGAKLAGARFDGAVLTDVKLDEGVRLR